MKAQTQTKSILKHIARSMARNIMFLNEPDFENAKSMYRSAIIENECSIRKIIKLLDRQHLVNIKF